MLKVTYLESGLYLEQLQETVEDWLTLRVILALRMGQRLTIESSTASLLLPVDLVKRADLAALVAVEEGITLALVDADYVEVSLRGTWIASGLQESEGVFVTVLNNPSIEQVLFNLWQMAQVGASIGR